MSIEAALAALTAAVEANTAALKAGAGATSAAPAPAPAASSEKKAVGRPKKEEAAAPAAPKSERTKDEMMAALNEVKEQKGVAEAKAIIKSAGGCDKMADIPESKIDAVYNAAKAALGGDEPEGDDDM